MVIMPKPYQTRLNDILAVMVSYQVGLAASETFTSLTDCLKAHKLSMDIVVYDNSREPISMGDYATCRNWFITYIHDQSNSGVSKAYNTAFSIARKKRKKWILLLDQDTRFPINALHSYIDSLTAHPGEHLFAPALLVGQKMISPCRYYFKRGFHLKSSSPGIHSIRHKTILNSGMCISADAFEKNNGYNDKIRLYFSDLDFIERYAKLFNSFCLIDMQCMHNHGHDNGNFDNTISRFRLYCEGARQSSHNAWDFIILFIMLSFRSLGYSVRHRSFAFVAIFARYFLQKT